MRETTNHETPDVNLKIHETVTKRDLTITPRVPLRVRGVGCNIIQQNDTPTKRLVLYILELYI